LKSSKFRPGDSGKGKKLWHERESAFADPSPSAVRPGIESTPRVQVPRHVKDLLELHPDPAVVADDEARYLHANPAATALLGYSREAFLTMNVRNLVVEGADWTENEYARFLREGRWAGPVTLCHRDGRILKALASATRLDLPGNTLCISVLRLLGPAGGDAADEELDARVEERTRVVEAANTELDAFAWSISHDLQAPLRAMNGFSGILIEDHSDELSDEARRCAAMIRESSEKMTTLVEDLLHFSRLGRQPLRKREVHPSQIAAGVLEGLMVGNGGRVVETHIAEMPICDADPALLRQVYVNLLSNALKYTRRSEHAEIEIGSTDDAGVTAYYVRDNGVGFDMRYAAKLFDVFQRLHSASEYEGTGAGLAVVRRIVVRHGGRVWADSSPNHGATFFFTLS
jgi:PAS domain S-box-containing protein